MNKSFDVFLIHKRGNMFKYLFLLSVALYFLLPVANAQEVETKVVEINNKKWLVTIEPGKEPMFKSLEPTRKKVTKLPFVINGKPEEEDIVSPVETSLTKHVVKSESRIVSECDKPSGCIVTEEGDCPSCREVHIKEETTQVVKSDYDVFKQDIMDDNNFEEYSRQQIIPTEQLPFYLQNISYLQNHPRWLCWKVMRTCWAQPAQTVSIKDLYVVHSMRHACESDKNWEIRQFDFMNTVESCKNMPIGKNKIPSNVIIKDI